MERLTKMLFKGERLKLNALNAITMPLNGGAELMFYLQEIGEVVEYFPHVVYAAGSVTGSATVSTAGASTLRVT